MTIRRAVLNLAKPVLTRTLWRMGTVHTIFHGPAKGLRYRIFPGYGFSPLYGGWEPDAQRLMVKHLHEGSVAYDIGANFGIHCLLMARLVGASGQVYAFEPMPDIMAALKENLALNQLTNVTFVPLAVSDQKGTAKFFTAHHRGAGHLAAVGNSVGEEISVEMTTLDSFVFEGKNQPPEFIKMDIEGAEGIALAGAERVIREFRPILLIDMHSNEQDLAVGRVLSRYSYEVYRTEGWVKVADLSRGRPDPAGLFDQVIAFPPLKPTEN